MNEHQLTTLHQLKESKNYLKVWKEKFASSKEVAESLMYYLAVHRQLLVRYVTLGPDVLFSSAQTVVSTLGDPRS